MLVWNTLFEKKSLIQNPTEDKINAFQKKFLIELVTKLANIFLFVRIFDKSAHTDRLKKSCWLISLWLKHLKSVLVNLQKDNTGILSITNWL